MGRMFNPPHPGEVLRDGVFDGTELTVTEFATGIGMSRVALSRVLHGCCRDFARHGAAT